MSSSFEIERVCQECSRLFIAKKTTTKYCSHKCNNRAYKRIKREEKLRTTRKEVKKALIKNDIPNYDRKKLFSIKETCQIVGVCRTTLYLWTKNNTIKETKVGGRVFISKEEIKRVFNL